MGFNIGTLHPLKKMVENNSNDGSNRDGGEDRPEYALEPKLFGKWSYDVDECPDMSLCGYLQVKTTKQQVFVPYTAGRYQARRFKKVQCPIVERLTNMIMIGYGRNNGKKQLVKTHSVHSSPCPSALLTRLSMPPRVQDPTLKPSERRTKSRELPKVIDERDGFPAASSKDRVADASISASV